MTSLRVGMMKRSQTGFPLHMAPVDWSDVARHFSIDSNSLRYYGLSKMELVKLSFDKVVLLFQLVPMAITRIACNCQQPKPLTLLPKKIKTKRHRLSLQNHQLSPLISCGTFLFSNFLEAPSLEWPYFFFLFFSIPHFSHILTCPIHLFVKSM